MFSLDKPCISSDFAGFVKRISMQFGLQDGYDSGMSEDWSGTEDVSKCTIYENAIIGSRRKRSSQSSSELARSPSPPEEVNNIRDNQQRKSNEKEKSAATISIVREMVGRQRKLSRQHNLQDGDSLVMQEATHVPIAPKRRSRTERKTRKEDRNKARSLSIDKRVRMEHPKLNHSLSCSFPDGFPVATSSPERHPCFDGRSIPPQPTVPAPILNNNRRSRGRGRGLVDEDFAAQVTGNEEVERTSAGHLLFNGRLSGAIQPRNCKLSESSCSNDATDVSHKEDLEEETVAETYQVTLQCANGGIGIGLIDGMFTPLKMKGIYVRTLVQNSPAAANGQLQVGDKILSVNGQTILGEDYHSAMDIIKSCTKESICFEVSRSTKATVLQITKSAF